MLGARSCDSNREWQIALPRDGGIEWKDWGWGGGGGTSEESKQGRMCKSASSGTSSSPWFLLSVGTASDNNPRKRCCMDRSVNIFFFMGLGAFKGGGSLQVFFTGLTLDRFDFQCEGLMQQLLNTKTEQTSGLCGGGGGNGIPCNEPSRFPRSNRSEESCSA